jgi:SAM-dependent methyltransferase
MNLTDAKKSPWFHSIDFSPAEDFVSKTRFSENVPPNYTLFGFYDLVQGIDLTGAEALDIGTMDGISSFILKRLGTKSVVATDIARRETFEFGAKTLGFDIDYKTDTDLYNIIEKTDRKRFDVVLMCGILYHVFDPLYAISTARQLTKLNGLAVIETHYLADESAPIMLFNPGDREPIDTENFFWRASESCLEAMFELCCFHVVSKISIGRRITYLLRAAKPSAMTESNPLTKKIHQRFMKLAHYRENIDFSRLEAEAETSVDRIKGEFKASKKISVQKYTPKVPFQPKWSPATGKR